jgi:hypothetical protein
MRTLSSAPAAGKNFAIVVNMIRKSKKLIQFVTFFQNLSMYSNGFGAGAVGAGDAALAPPK